MVIRSVCRTLAAIIVLAMGLDAQQPAASPKPAENASSHNVTMPAAAPASAQSNNVVLRIGSTQVTQSEIDAIISGLDTRAKIVIATEGRRPVADEYIRTLLLSEKALEQHLDQSPNIRLELEMQREQILAQAEYQRIVSDNPISEEEINQYFVAHKSQFETVEFSEFLVRKRPADKDGSDPLQGLPPEQAKATAEKIRQALLSGKTVEQVAETYSQTAGVILLAPKPRTAHRADMKAALEKATFSLSDGEVSEVVDNVQAFIVVKVFRHQQGELKDVSSDIRTKLQRERLEAEIEALRNKAGIWMDEEYFKSPAESASTNRPMVSKPQSKP